MSDDSTTTSMFTPNKQLKELSRQVLSLHNQIRDQRGNISNDTLSRLNQMYAIDKTHSTPRTKISPPSRTGSCTAIRSPSMNTRTGP